MSSENAPGGGGGLTSRPKLENNVIGCHQDTGMKYEERREAIRITNPKNDRVKETEDEIRS